MKRELVLLLCMFFEIVGIQKLDASSMHTKGLETLMRVTGIKLLQKPANPNTRDQPQSVSQSGNNNQINSTSVASLKQVAQAAKAAAMLKSSVIKKRGIKGS